jgi:CRP/FNR family cyclic AMP-dependent transcriptional regulator
MLTNTDHNPLLVQRLAQRGQIRQFRKGNIFIVEGSVNDDLFVLLEGRVKAFCFDKNDKEITFGVYTAGDYVGEMALDGGPRSASIVALEPTKCAVISRQVLLDFISEFPEFSLDLLTKVIRRARMATGNARNLVFIDVYGRLALFLEESSTVEADGVRRVNERLTHQDLAGYVGCSREMISRILKDLERGHYISSEKKVISLLKKLPARW